MAQGGGAGLSLPAEDDLKGSFQDKSPGWPHPLHCMLPWPCAPAAPADTPLSLASTFARAGLRPGLSFPPAT